MKPKPLQNPAAVALGRLGGLAKSDAKGKASAENGKKGGRPKKAVVASYDVAVVWGGGTWSHCFVGTSAPTMGLILAMFEMNGEKPPWAGKKAYLSAAATPSPGKPEQS